ncbi:MAG: phosphoribosylformylglycinamidine cyclo-ligase [Candidatus Diapherotrites archaeon]|nr:phosphoribosylformylglycinamidine cyclo-ligase [Candidatus Diapherotrites archaeon]
MVSYKDSGVDISANNKSNELIKKHVKSTFSNAVSCPVGGFGGAMNVSFLKKFKEPVLVSSMDGVGTKVKVAAMINKFDSVGEDIVNHCINDILAVGATPLFFLDYFASSKLNPLQVEQIVKGIANACRKNKIILIGGETAEMPSVYCENEFDLAGCITGVTEKKDLLPKKDIKEGDILIGFPSNGLHTNGYSLARNVLFNKAKFNANDKPSELKGKTIAEALLAVHTSYLEEVLALRKKFKVKAFAHITGGGFYDNIPRVLPENLGVKINKNSFPILEIFKLIAEKGNIEEKELFHAFNMGIGGIVILPKSQAKKAMDFLKKNKMKAYLIGKVIKGKKVLIE